MPRRRLRLRTIPGEFAVCRLGPADSIPHWASGGGFVSITRTAEGLSIVCDQEAIPAGVRHDSGWGCFQLQGPIPFSEIGVLASLVQPLAHAGISVFAVSTFDTDYILVKRDRVAAALAAWIAAGHEVEPRD
jgi:uncharacterized protein